MGNESDARVTDGVLTAIRIGALLRQRREQFRWNSDDLARRTTIPTQIIEEIEAGTRLPTIQVLYDLAQSLRAAPGDLLPADSATPHRPVQLPITDAEDAAVVRVLGGGTGHPTQIYLFELGPGDEDGGFRAHVGDELLIVLHGAVWCRVEDGPDVLVTAGQSRCIDTASHHGIRASPIARLRHT